METPKDLDKMLRGILKEKKPDGQFFMSDKDEAFLKRALENVKRHGWQALVVAKDPNSDRMMYMLLNATGSTAITIVSSILDRVVKRYFHIE